MLFESMLKFAALSAVALLSLSSSVEAARDRHRHRRHSHHSKRHVISKCKEQDQVAYSVGGFLGPSLMETVNYAIRKEYPDLTVFLNGKDFKRTRGVNKYKHKRYVRFLHKVADAGYGIGVLPWRPIGQDDEEPSKSRVLKYYRDSARYLARYLKLKPRAIWVNAAAHSTRVLKALRRKHYILIGKTTAFKRPEDDFEKKSFIVAKSASSTNIKQVVKDLKTLEDSTFSVVSLYKCLGDRAIFSGGLRQEGEEEEEE